MESKNKLNEVPLASVNEKELKSIKDLESQLGNKYYIIAFDRNEK